MASPLASLETCFEEGDFEELNDKFVLDAAKEPEDGEEEEVFNYNEHICLLMERARLLLQVHTLERGA